MWDRPSGWAGAFAVTKSLDEIPGSEGFWDVIHVVEVTEDLPAKKADIKLTSTFLFNFEVVGEPDPDAGCSGTPPPINFSGQSSLDDKKELTLSDKNLDAQYLEAIGPMLENQENEFRQNCEKIQLPKASEVMNAMCNQRIGSRQIQF